MKFKSIFLGMLGMAAIVSCNNETIGTETDKGGNADVVEGLPIYATMSIGFANEATTYAGTNDVAASTAERTARTAAMYIYKADPSGSVPECAVYIASVPTSNLVTMKTTSGSKKIYVAVNPTGNAAGASLTETASYSEVSSPMAASMLFSTLNNQINSTGTSIALNTPAPAKTRANGLIQNLAMADLYGTGAGTYSQSAAQAPLMTNWEATDDVATSSTHNASVDHILTADVDSVGSQTHATNHIEVFVQRAYAKVSLRITAPTASGSAITTPSGLSTANYQAAVGLDQEGRFYPWGSAANQYWSLGNIPTATRPFQTYSAGHVRDQWATMTDDSLSNATMFNTWASRYDNNRVFPMGSISSYPSSALNVTNVKQNMTTTGNYTNLTPAAGAPETAMNYVYTTENAREHPVLKDHQTFAILGGFYQPKNVITTVTRAAVITNPPTLTYNAGGATFSWTPSAGDSLYYIVDDNVFIVGKQNLLGYYAWAATQSFQPSAGGTGGAIAASAVAASSEPFNTNVQNAINDDIDNGVLFAYFEGQCWYRVYLVNDNTGVDATDKVIVARNHIYDVNITNIKGPGIADPNKIIIPGEPVLDLDTYVSATITVLDWHKVGQSVEVDSK